MEGKLMHLILSTDGYNFSPKDFQKHLIKCANITSLGRLSPGKLLRIEQSCGGDSDRFVSNLFEAVNADDDWEYQYYHYVNVSLRFEPMIINERMFQIESNMDALRDDLLALVKLFFAFSDGSTNCFEIIGVDPDCWGPLQDKYNIDLNDLVKIAWTYPYLSLMVLKVYARIERPVQMDLMADYENFKSEFRFIGLFSLIPPQSKYGGFVKALLHHMVLQFFISMDDHVDETYVSLLKFVIALARVIFHSGVRETYSRDEFIRFLDISIEDCEKWSDVFDRQYTEFADVHIKYFEQLE